MENQTGDNEKDLNNSADAAKNTTSESQNTGSKITLIAVIVVLVLAALIFLFTRLAPATTAKIRDVSIIIFVLGNIVTVSAIVVLVVQLSRLVNFLKYELMPIFDNTKKTVRKFSGTVSFLCDNAIEPTMKASSTLAGIKNAAEGVVSLFKK